jgi:hypothetical protein
MNRNYYNRNLKFVQLFLYAKFEGKDRLVEVVMTFDFEYLILKFRQF